MRKTKKGKSLDYYFQELEIPYKKGIPVRHIYVHTYAG